VRQRQSYRFSLVASKPSRTVIAVGKTERSRWNFGKTARETSKSILPPPIPEESMMGGKEKKWRQFPATGDAIMEQAGCKRESQQQVGKSRKTAVVRVLRLNWGKRRRKKGVSQKKKIYNLFRF